MLAQLNSQLQDRMQAERPVLAFPSDGRSLCV